MPSLDVLIFGHVSALELRAQSWGLPVSSYRDADDALLPRARIAFWR